MPLIHHAFSCKMEDIQAIARSPSDESLIVLYLRGRTDPICIPKESIQGAEEAFEALKDALSDSGAPWCGVRVLYAAGSPAKDAEPEQG